MNRRGVCYDVGRVMWGQDWRPQLSPEEARRELQIIRDDLHCNAVRICGQDLGRLMAAGGHALDCGLQVRLSPELRDHSPGDTAGYIAKAADAAEELHRHRPGQVVFSVGSEATLFMAGIVEGTSVFERLERPDFWERIKAGEHNGPLNVFLAEAAERAREVFHGPVTYAPVPPETAEWSRFDFVSVDLYRGAQLKDRSPTCCTATLPSSAPSRSPSPGAAPTGERPMPGAGDSPSPTSPRKTGRAHHRGSTAYTSVTKQSRPASSPRCSRSSMPPG